MEKRFELRSKRGRGRGRFRVGVKPGGVGGPSPSSSFLSSRRGDEDQAKTPLYFLSYNTTAAFPDTTTALCPDNTDNPPLFPSIIHPSIVPTHPGTNPT